MTEATVSEIDCKTGRYPAGEDLYLVVSPDGSRSWVFHGKRQEVVLGPADVITLGEARDIADDARAFAAAGWDPSMACPPGDTK